jgi:hypothetical protein
MKTLLHLISLVVFVHDCNSVTNCVFRLLGFVVEEDQVVLEKFGRPIFGLQRQSENGCSSESDIEYIPLLRDMGCQDAEMDPEGIYPALLRSLTTQSLRDHRLTTQSLQTIHIDRVARSPLVIRRFRMSRNLPTHYLLQRFHRRPTDTLSDPTSSCWQQRLLAVKVVIRQTTSESRAEWQYCCLKKDYVNAIVKFVFTISVVYCTTYYATVFWPTGQVETCFGAGSARGRNVVRLCFWNRISFLIARRTSIFIYTHTLCASTMLLKCVDRLRLRG